VEAEQGTTQREGFVDVDAIISPQVELERPTSVEEEAQAQPTTSMEINLHDSAQGHQTNDTGNLQQHVRSKETQITNGEANENTEVVMPIPQPEVGFTQHQEGLVEDITRQPNSGRDHRQAEVGTASASITSKGKQPMARSPHKQPDATLMLSLILEGVQSPPTLLGCMEKLKYSDHDVVDTRKIPEFA
jgi:hypothetical protein